MNEKQLLAAPEDDYMNTEQLQFFDKKLIELKQQTIDEIETIRADISLNRVSDMNDRATIEEETRIAVRLVERKDYLIKKIDAARERIRLGDYGYCLESGEPIGIQRLLIRPTAELCTDIKQLNERREQYYDDKAR